MSVETATYINQLVPTNPTTGDAVGQGDDHLRLIKAALQSTFPDVTGPILFVPATLAMIQPGMMIDYAGTTAPTGWLMCYGQAISRVTYADLFTAMGTAYGVGDGSTTFNLPDYRGRVSAGKDDMGGTSANRLTGLAGGLNGNTMGASGGAESHVLTQAQLPNVSLTGTAASAGAHSHLYNMPTGNSGSDSSSGGYDNRTATASSTDGAHTHTVTVSLGGSDTAHNNVQPTLIATKIIFTGVA